MSTTTTTTTTTRDRGDRYGPMEWAQLRYMVANNYLLLPCLVIPPLPNKLLSDATGRVVVICWEVEEYSRLLEISHGAYHIILLVFNLKPA